MSLSGKEKFSYGLGAVGKDMVYMLSASYILYYYQDILGVNAVAMGIILLVARTDCLRRYPDACGYCPETRFRRNRI